MFRFNLTSLILLVGMTFLFVLSVRQCDKKKYYKDAYQQQQSEYVAWEHSIISEYKAEKRILRDSIQYYKDLIKGNNAKVIKARRRINVLELQLRTLKDEMTNISPDSSYAFLQALRPPKNDLDYPFAQNQVSHYHQTYLEKEKVDEIRDGLEVENKYLKLNSIAAGDMLLQLESELEECDFSVLQMELDAKVAENREKIFKKRLRRTRIIAGVTTIIAALAIL